MEFWKLQKKSLALLDQRSRRKFYFAILAQCSLGLIDVAGVLLSGVIGTMASTSFTHLATPKPIMRLLEILHLANQTPTNAMLILSFCVLGFFLSKTVLALIFTRKTLRFLAHQQTKISSLLVSKVLNSEYSWLSKQDPQEISTYLTQGVSAATVNSLGQALLLSAEIALVIFFMLLLIIIKPVIAIGTIIYMFLVLYGLNSFIAKRVTEYHYNLVNLTVQGMNNLFNSLKLFRELRVLRRTQWFEDMNTKIAVDQARYYSDDVWIQQIPKYALEVALMIGATLLLLAGRFSSDSEHLIPILAIYLAGAARIFPSLLRIQSCLFTLRSHAYLAGKAHEILETLKVEEVQVRQQIVPQSRPSQDSLEKKERSADGANDVADQPIELKQLSFSYPDSKTKALSDVSFEIKPGERVAIVGPSGAGKSTLCDLFLGLLSPTSGLLQIGKVPASEWIESHIGKVAYLPQEITLVSGTVLENICIGLNREDIDLERVFHVVHRAQLDEFVSNLPNGLDTYLGVNGAELSGGQKQRIGIARALYSEPNIVVMDEATSALDAETEFAIMNVLATLGEQTTVIFIAHRLSSIRDFPRILYFEDGQLLADGSFSEVRDLIPRFEKQVKLLSL